MKKLIFIICATTCCTLFADWHSWDTPPKKDQLYMVVNMEPCHKVEDRQILIITHFDKHYSICRYKGNGWWEANPHDMRRWFSEGSKILYCPTGYDEEFIRRIEGMLASKEIKK